MCVGHPNILTSQKLRSHLGLFGLKSFHWFAILVGRIKAIACLVFYLVMKMLENLYKKPYQTRKTVVKILTKHENLPTGRHKKRQILFHRFLSEYTLPLPCYTCFWRENEKWVNWENWVGGRTNFSKTYYGKMGGERENTKFVSLMRCFCFNLHTINYHGNWYCLYFVCMFVYYINQACN